MDISVVFSTYKRFDVLKKTLESFTRLDVSGLTWEILAIDNACLSQTRELIEQYGNRLPIRYIEEPKPGKNVALNNHISEAKGELIVLTDDDILPDTQWLREMLAGARRWPNDTVFGGRILPAWPDGKKAPAGLETHFFNSAFTIADWDYPEGPYPAGQVWGPNMAVRRKIFDKGYRFAENIGPALNLYIMGSETEFTKRLEKNGYRSIFLPQSWVFHQIRPEQLTKKWLYQRAIRYGRADVYFEKHDIVPFIFGAPRFMYRMLLTLTLARLGAFIMNNYQKKLYYGIEWWMMLGRIYQFRANPKNSNRKC